MKKYLTAVIVSCLILVVNIDAKNSESVVEKVKNLRYVSKKSSNVNGALDKLTNSELYEYNEWFKVESKSFEDYVNNKMENINLSNNDKIEYKKNLADGTEITYSFEDNELDKKGNVVNDISSRL